MFNKMTLRNFFLAVAGAVAMSGPALADVPRDVNVQAGDLAQALDVLAKQCGVDVVYPSQQLKGMTTKGVSGTLETREAFERLIEGTRLVLREDGKSVMISLPKGEAGRGKEEEQGIRLAQAEAAEQSGPSEGQESGTGDDGVQLDEIVVTGTHIRGAASPSPLVLIDRDYIERSGYSTLYQVLQTLPQNYGGGDTESTHSSPGGSSGNVSYGSSVNLRGLGSSSTLVLLNGQRVAPAAYGQFIDISLIPLSAIERVEVMSDGASAIYGSDAVAGVVNIILRDSYDGAETRLQGGAASEGSISEYRFSQTVGANWATGGVLANYEYFQRGDLDASERSYSAGSATPFGLLPKQKTQSLLAVAHTRLSDRVRLRGTALASERDADQMEFRGEVSRTLATSRQVSTSVSAEVDLGGTWRTTLTGTYGLGKTRSIVRTPSSSPDLFDRAYDFTSLDAQADGALFELPAGNAKLAIGASLRNENFEDEEQGGLPSRDRDVLAAFAEVLLPIVSAENARAGMQRLEVTIAGRYEDYSDFGDTTNPRYGLLWSPIAGLNLRGTYGTSFKAPTFFQLDESNLGVLLFDLPDPAAPDLATLTMWATGNNTQLKPERSRTWTVGLDVEPASVPKLKFSLTYFDTIFKDRIVEPLPGLEVLGLFSQADVYAPIILRDPDPATVVELMDRAPLTNLYGPFVPDDVEAIFNQQLQNLSTEEVRGLDLNGSYGFSSSVGDWSFQLASTKLLDFTDFITSAAPANEVLDTAYHQVDWKARAGAAWSRNGLSFFGALNYVDGFSNRTVTPAAEVGSWTTVDMQAAYATRESTGWLSGTRLALNVVNIFDRAPPRMVSPIAEFDIGFDPTNASPLGRFLSLELLKAW